MLQAVTAGGDLRGPRRELGKLGQGRLKITKYLGITFESHLHQDGFELENG